jgi:hypothetical protein
MRLANWTLMGWLAAAMLGLPAAAPAGENAEFDRFCSQWMDKLAVRERQNLARMRWVQRGSVMVGQYTGYARRPLHCQPTSAVTPGRPAVGKLVYEEIEYQKTGTDAAAAKIAEPAVLRTTEVMEVFRYDGRRWMY